ncbi:MAG: histidinol dehydrogenase [Actinomyces sp.]|nr:MAG: histidinol dehydrogenase [Actinomyces sp.]
MLSRLDLRSVTGPVAAHLPRPRTPADGPVEVVRDIIETVRRRGDAALIDFTRRFDGVPEPRLSVGPTEPAAALERLDADQRTALRSAHDAIARYHRAQMPADVVLEDAGLRLRGLHRPVHRAGCYVPGGRAAYPSTVLMTAVPARIAGVSEVVLCVPPGPDGRVPDLVLAAAAVAGVDEIHPVGGAQAIAALAHGTESIDPVDVIVGPGNVYVALAKQEVAGLVGVPSSFAGPSEVVVIADASVPPRFAAIDVIVQAEHGPDGLAWLVTWDEEVADRVSAEIAALVEAAPRRDEILATLGTSGHVVVCRDAAQAVDVADAIAPEHLELLVADPEALLERVHNAGAVFVGPWSPASLGDYVAGPSHVLPTNGTARFASALTVHDFLKDLHVVEADQAAFARLGPVVETLATAEGLAAHADSIRLRREAAP